MGYTQCKKEKMKMLKKYNSNAVTYTPVVKQEKNGSVFVIPFGRPIKACDQKELEKKMKNRRSALEARKRQKQKEETLHSDYLRLNEENYALQQQNDYYQNLLEKYLRHGVSSRW